MPPTTEQLNNLKTSLSGISQTLASLSAKDKKKFENSASSDLLSKGLTNLSGTLTSASARKKLENSLKDSGIKNQMTENNDPLSNALSRLAESEKGKKLAEESQKNAEANLSLREQQQSSLESALAQSKDISGSEKKETPTTQNNVIASLDTIQAYGLTPEQASDPFIVSEIEKNKAEQTRISTVMDSITEMFKDESRDTQALMTNINAMAANQNQMIETEFKKRTAGATLAGIYSSRAQYSPLAHQSAIAEVVLEGKAKLDEIEIKATELKLQAQKDLREFKSKSVIESSELLKEYNELKTDTLLAIRTELSRVEEQERNKTKFDQEQADRSALILSEELVDASDDQIKAVAESYGIDFGLLKKAVADATFLSKDRKLDLESKRASIDNTYDLMRQRSEKEKETGSNPEEVSAYADAILDAEKNDENNFQLNNVPESLRGAVAIELASRKNQKMGEEIKNIPVTVEEMQNSVIDYLPNAFEEWLSFSGESENVKDQFDDYARSKNYDGFWEKSKIAKMIKGDVKMQEMMTLAVQGELDVNSTISIIMDYLRKEVQKSNKTN